MKSFWNSYFRPVIKFMFPALLIGAIIGIYPGVKSYKYVWKNDSFCLRCHNHEYVMPNLKTSLAHKKINCTDCHSSSLHAFFKQARDGVKNNLDPMSNLAHLPKISARKCFSCHSKEKMSGLHQKHLEGFTKFIDQSEIDLKNIKVGLATKGIKSRSVSCGDCHGGVMNRVHNLSVGGESCLRCHNDAHKGSLVTQKYGCKACHYQDFL